VVENFRRGVHHNSHRVVITLKIGYQNLDMTARHALMYRPDRHGEKLGAAVLAVVAVHAGDDGMAQPHHYHRLRHPARLIHIHFQRRALLHRAKSAAARAHVAQDHERRRALIPALPNVRAGGRFAHRVELQLLHQRLQLAIVFANRRGRFEPLGPFGLGLNGDEHYYQSTARTQPPAPR
jgi:hypothetical protein